MDQFGYLAPESGKTSCSTKIPKVIFAIFMVAIVIAAIAALIAGSVTTKEPPFMQIFARSVTMDNIVKTLVELESLADANGGNRAVGPGFDASLALFSRILSESADCDVSYQEFGVPTFFEDHKPLVSIRSPYLNYTLQTSTDVITMNFGGNGTYEIPEGPIFLAKNFGCSPEDLQGAKGKIALIFYNPDSSIDCTAYQKALNAFNAESSAILVANDASRHRLSASRLRGSGYSPGAYQFVQIPTLAISYMTASTLLNLEGATMSIKASTRIVIQRTKSLLCTTREGDPEKLMVFGAHLDSVPAGPGINDNGSGAAMLLEIAKQLKTMKVKVVNQVQFSWWGAEEPGLIGSRFFVNHTKSTDPSKWNRIKAALNFDTMASPNGIPQLYNIHLKNEDNETFPNSAVSGSVAINSLFTTRFNQLNQPFLEIAFEGGSDYYPFVQNGIPTGGLDGGAADTKTVEQAAIYGGLPNFVMDPCYHEPCDRVSNLGLDMLTVMADAAAFTIGSLATEKDLVKFLSNSDNTKA